MANKILNTRVQLRYDSYTNWEAHKTSVPLKGEMCICTAGTVNPNVDDVLLKVGDGTTTWELLSWVSAKAADVHEWAKLPLEDFLAKFKAGKYISVSVINGEVTYAHSDTTTTRTETAETPDHGETFTVIDTVETDTLGTGHITKVNTKTITLPSLPEIKHTIVAAGDKIDVEKTSSTDGQDTYTVSHEKITRDDGLVTETTVSDRTITVITGIDSDDFGHITSADVTTFTLPEDNDTTYDLSSPANKTNGNVTVDLTAGGSGSGTDSVHIVGSGATTVTSDTDGKIVISSTDNNTEYEIKTTSATDKAIISLDSIKNEDDSNIEIVGSDATTVVSDSNGKITISSHDTQFSLDAVSSGTSGAALKLNKDNVDQDTVNIKSGSNVTISVDDSGDITISSVYENTTYTAGSGLNLTGTEFSHYIPTKVADNITAEDRTYVKSVTFDDFGHVTAISTGTETVVDTDTQTSVIGDNKYIKVDGELKTNSSNTFTVSLDENALKTLIASDVTAAMEFMGVADTLPTGLSTGDKGHMYKVTGTFKVNDETAKVGDSIVWDGTQWFLIPSGDDIEDTWRPIYVGNDSGANLGNVPNGKEILFDNGDGISVSGSISEDHDYMYNISFNHDVPENVATDITPVARTYVTGLEFDKFGHVVGVETASEDITHNPDISTVIGDKGSFTADVDGDSVKIAGDGVWTSTEVSGDVLTVSHKNSTVSAGSYSGTSSSASVAHGSDITIPSFSVDAAGHVTAASTTTFKLPTNTEVTVKENPDSSSLIVEKTVKEKDENGNDIVEYNVYHKQYETANVTKVADRDLAHGNTFTAITGLTFEEGHVDTVGVTTYTLPTESNGFAAVTPANSTATTAITKNTTSVTADSSADTLTIAAGNKWVELAGDDSADKITIAHSVGTAGQAGALSFNSTTGVLTVPGAKWDEAGHVVSDVSRTIDLSALKPTKDNDTTGKNIVGASASAKENAAVTGTSTNGVTVAGTTQKIYSADGVHLNHVETLDGTSTVVSSHKISGDGFIAVKSDASGNITVGVEQTGTDTLILVCGGADL